MQGSLEFGSQYGILFGLIPDKKGVLKFGPRALYLWYLSAGSLGVIESPLFPE